MSVITVTDENFESTVLQSDLPFLVDFWADWCPPCHMMAPIIEDLARNNASTMHVGKLNVDENNNAAFTYKITAIPTMILFVGGKAMVAISGAMPEQAVMERLAAHLAK
ncbi:MAG: thioredoxin [Coriobacteriia bacterium]|nr:thioredoxin [Coriobacteriia bacterium]